MRPAPQIRACELPLLGVQERRGGRLLARSALALAAVQAACAYVVWVATAQQAQRQHLD